MVDESTIMPIVPHLLAQNSCSWLIFWITARLQMMSRCIGWGPKPTWNGSHMCFRPFIRSGLADGSTFIPLPPYLLRQSLGWLQIFWITVRLQMMSRCIGWGPEHTWTGSHIHSFKTCFRPFICLMVDESTITLVCPEFTKLADFLDHSKATNDVKVHWLRPQTHMEWFPHPLHTYTMCFNSFLCCQW
jgi:hypothetical protein